MQLRLSQEVKEHHFLIRCKPMEHEHQHCGNYSFRIDPFTTIDEVEDGFGNRGFVVMIKEAHDYVNVTSEGIVDIYEGGVREVLHPMYCYPSVYTMPEDNIRIFLKEAEQNYGNKIRTAADAEFLMHYLAEHFRYVPYVTDTRTTASQALAGGQGVCQDYAHIFISLLRLCKIPARYVAGMMYGEGASHAWVEIWQDGMWIGMDPTNHQMVDDHYIKLTHGRDFADGTIDKGCFLGFAYQSQNILVKVEERT